MQSFHHEPSIPHAAVFPIRSSALHADRAVPGGLGRGRSIYPPTTAAVSITTTSAADSASSAADADVRRRIEDVRVGDLVGDT
ncbi:MAG TPA: hypothetical protein DDZ51_02140 [Planctomycetaceae bacterium]|nr:hypothetical protein [Planctomycetaceae bacterium]